MAATTIEPITTTPPEVVDIPDDTCYVCGGEQYTDCEECALPICKEHMREFEGWCHIDYRYCPKCDAKRRKQQEMPERQAS